MSRAWVGVLVPVVFAVSSLSAPSIAGANGAVGGWEYVKTDEGVVIYRKEVEGSDVVAFKGVTYADQPIGKILAIFEDSNQRVHWVDRYKEHTTLETGKYMELYWIHFALPWPVSDRD